MKTACDYRVMSYFVGLTLISVIYSNGALVPAEVCPLGLPFLELFGWFSSVV